MPDLDSKDSKKDDCLPKPVQMSTPNVVEELFVRPLNKFAISRTFGSLQIPRAVVDPNLHISLALLRKSTYSSPVPNLQLSLWFGSVGATIQVVPFAPGPVHPRESTLYRTEDKLKKLRSMHQVSLKAHTFMGNLALRVCTQPSARFSVDASSTFGQTRVYIPRTFHGPLQVWTWTRTPRLSPGLKRAAVPAWVHWAKNAVIPALLLLFMYWAPWWAGLAAVFLTVILATFIGTISREFARE
ncbi:hypothetical protein C8R44DRAFT_38848 [Mycena epipterygia]|nr:hypothetical protein C8R44DRAFT_38848 [Mycena epipterygia]